VTTPCRATVSCASDFVQPDASPRNEFSFTKAQSVNQAFSLFGCFDGGFKKAAGTALSPRLVTTTGSYGDEPSPPRPRSLC